jgi:hypothetical protein
MTIHQIQRSLAKESIKDILPRVVDAGWAPFVYRRSLFSGPDLYHCQDVLLLGSMVAACRATIVVHTENTDAENTGVGPVDQMTWAELHRAVATGTVYGDLNNAAPPFQMLVAAAACFENITLHGPANLCTVPPALIKIVKG